MIDDDLERLSQSELRDYADDPRVERIWRRLNRGLARPRSGSRASLAWAPAFGIALFVAGVWVGRQGTPRAEIAAPAMQPERALLPSEPVRAAAPVAAPGAVEEPAIVPPQPSVARARTPLRTNGAGALVVMPEPRSQSRGEPAASHNVAPSGPPAWQKSADLGDFDGALSEIRRAGGWDAALNAASPEQLMTLVDVARASGERDQAVRALRRLLNVFPAAPEAPLAAWTLGNLLEQAGDSEGSAEAYALYRRLSPEGDFAEDAAARQVDAALAQRDSESATALLDQYAKDFPNGRRLGELREELAKLTQELASDTGAEPAPPPAATAVPPSAP